MLSAEPIAIWEIITSDEKLIDWRSPRRRRRRPPQKLELTEAQTTLAESNEIIIAAVATAPHMS